MAGDFQERLDAAEEEVQRLRSDLVLALREVDSLDARVAQRCALIRSASLILGRDARLDGLSDHQIRVQALQRADSTFSAEAVSEDYVRGLFDRLSRYDAASVASLERLRTDVAEAAGSGPEKSAILKNIEAAASVPRAWDTK